MNIDNLCHFLIHYYEDLFELYGSEVPGHEFQEMMLDEALLTGIYGKAQILHAPYIV